MKTVKCLAILIMALAIGTSAFAQDAPAGKRGAQKQEMMKKRFEEFSTKLNLRPDQQEKVKVMLREHAEELRSIKKNPDHTPESRKAAVKQSTKKLDDQIITILDDSQKEAYKKHKEERRAEMKKKAEERRKQKEELQEESIF